MTFKRRVLSGLGKDQLLEIGRGLELEVGTRMGVDDLRDLIAKSKRASLSAIVQESLSRDALKQICTAVGVDDTGKEKSVLVERILAASANGSGYKIEPTTTGGTAREGAAPFGALPLGLNVNSTEKPAKAKAKGKAAARRRAGIPESESMVSGSLKGALRQFALGAAGGYSGRDAYVSFATHLLECFCWKEGRPEGADIPRRLSWGRPCRPPRISGRANPPTAVDPCFVGSAR